MAIRRLFGYVADATVGGSEYDDLSAGGGGQEPKAIPDSTKSWPVTGGSYDRNLERIDRNDEVRGRRAVTAPLPFRAGPMITVPVAAYRSVIEILLAKTLGGTDTRVGTAPAAINHTLTALGFGATALPPINVQLVRDDLNHKMSGGVINRLSLNFPLDGEGTAEAEIWGLYGQQFAGAPPSAVFTGESPDVMMLRDAAAYFDPSAVPAPPTAVTGTAITDLQGFEMTWVNNLNRKWYAKRNVSTMTNVGSAALTRKLWWPAENKLGAAQDVSFALNFGNVSAAQEFALEYGQLQKLVFDVSGAPLTTTPAATEWLRITIYAAEYTGGGSADLAARDDITSRFEGGAFYETVAAKDVQVEIVNGSNTDLIAA